MEWIMKNSVADPRSEFFHPGSGSASNILCLFNPKKLFLSSRINDLGCSFRIPDPDPDFFQFGSRIRICNTDEKSAGLSMYGSYLPGFGTAADLEVGAKSLPLLQGVGQVGPQGLRQEQGS
jgi:hypothetical protein